MSKKKLAGIIISVFLAVVIIAGVIVYAVKLPHPLSYDIRSVECIGSTVELISKTDDCVTIRNTENRDFKILAFTDMHLDGNNETSTVTVSNLVNNIVKEKPDLVILGGDNVTSGLNRKRANQLAKIFENLGVYWAGVIGNHEGDNNFSITRDEMMNIFTGYEHCLMLKGKDEVWGVCNYSLNILNYDGSLSETFVFMDTGDECSEETISDYNIENPTGRTLYDGTKASQVEWYKSVMAETKESYGDFNSILVVHIPLYQYRTAWLELEEKYADKEFACAYENLEESGDFKLRGVDLSTVDSELSGVLLERGGGICESAFDSGLFDAIKECGSTQAVFCGHDHLNTFSIPYEGVQLNYFQPSGYGSYGAKKLGLDEKDWLQGYTVIEIASDGAFTQQHYRNSENME